MSNKLPLSDALKRLAVNEEKFEGIVNGAEGHEEELGGKITPSLRTLFAQITSEAFADECVQRACACAKHWALQANKIATEEAVISTGGTEARPIPDRFADILNVKDFGAKGDGITDDTLAIRAAINSANPWSAIFFPNSNSEYIVSDIINIDVQGLNIFGRATVKQVSNNTTFLINADYVCIRGLHIIGKGKDSVGGAGVYFKRTKHSSIVDCVISDNWRNVNTGGDKTERITYNCAVVNCTLMNSVTANICNSYAAYISIINNTIDTSGYEHITLDNGTIQCRVIGNKLSGHVGGAGAISMDESDNNIISNNHIFQTLGSVPCLTANGNTGVSNGNIITGNYFECALTGIPDSKVVWLKGFEGASAGNKGYYGANKNIISNNYIRGAETGIVVEKNSANNIISNNAFASNVSKKVDLKNTSNVFSDISLGNESKQASPGPLSKRVSIDIPSAGSEITAPGNGYICGTFEVKTSAQNGWIGLRNISSGFGSRTYNRDTGFNMELYIPVSGGDNVTVFYPGTLDESSALYFIPRRGEV